MAAFRALTRLLQKLAELSCDHRRTSRAYSRLAPGLRMPDLAAGLNPRLRSDSSAKRQSDRSATKTATAIRWFNRCASVSDGSSMRLYLYGNRLEIFIRSLVVIDDLWFAACFSCTERI